TGFQCSSTELTSAKLYIQQKNYDKALEALNNEVSKNPQSDEGFYLLGVVYGEQEKFSEMVDVFNKSLAVSNKFEKDINDTKRYYWANLFNKGVTLYQRATSSQNPDSSKVNYDLSITAFDHAIAIEPDSADAYRNLAFVQISRGEYDKAIAPLEKLITLNTEPEGYRFLGEILYNKGIEAKAQDSVKAQEYFNKAITVLEQGRKDNPTDSDILLLLSNAYIGANKLDVAIDAFKAGVATEPENQYYRYNYGVVLLGSGNFTEAEEQFKKAVEIDPNYDKAIYNLAVTYVRWGTALSLEAEEKGIQSTEHKAKYELALPHLEKMTQLKPDDAQAWELLGRVYTVLGMADKATNAFAKADELRGK
ncbi:MAG: tetratricopeptide repeat protein, partial [Ignavibacteriaceae bacterium]